MNPAGTQSGYVLVIACLIVAKKRFQTRGKEH